MKRIEVEQKTIFIGLAGSHAYGLNRPDSDYDYRGVFIAPKRYYLGFERIKAILKGEYSYEQVMKMADDLVAQMDVVYNQSTLPPIPDLNQINELCIELVEMQGWSKVAH